MTARIARASSPILLLPREERAHLGNPDACRWCPTCRERTSAFNKVTFACMWCPKKTITVPL